jgi:hypothetical protein
MKGQLVKKNFFQGRLIEKAMTLNTYMKLENMNIDWTS